MKFLVLFTTQSRRAFPIRNLLFPASIFLSFVVGPTCMAQADAIPSKVSGNSPASLSELVKANDLQSTGKRPFHLQVSFKIFSMSGAAFETGTLDYWWAGEKEFTLEITSPSIGTVHNVRLDGVSTDVARRSLYFVNQLLVAMRAPAGVGAFYKGAVVVSERKNGPVQLRCFKMDQTASGMEVCAAPSGGAIRTVEQPDSLFVRNTLATFAGTDVALDEMFYFAGRLAIQGHIEKLERFDPERSPVALASPGDATSQPKTPSASVPGEVFAGKILTKVNPIYPGEAKYRHIQGTVILHVAIDESGHPGSIFVLASPDAELTEAATKAVKQWVYQPTLLNGTPVRLDTTVSVNFRTD